MDGLSATVFRGKMHPVDLANRLLRAVDLNLAEGPLGPEIANDLTVRVHPSEIDDQIEATALEAELAVAVSDLAADRGWRIGGPVTVHIAPDENVGAGSITLDGRATPGSLPTWAQLIDAAGGRVLEVGDNRTLIGRGADTDLTLTEPEISRQHALILRSGGTPWLYDLGSANGTSVNGVPLGDHPAALHPGDAVAFGPASFTFRLV